MSGRCAGPPARRGAAPRIGHTPKRLRIPVCLRVGGDRWGAGGNYRTRIASSFRRSDEGRAVGGSSLLGDRALGLAPPAAFRLAAELSRSRFAHVAWGLSAILGAGSPLAARFSPSVGSQSLAARSRTERGRLTRPLVRTDHKSPQPRIVDRSAGRLPRRRSLTTGGPGETEVDGGRPTLLVREVMAPSWQINRQVTASGIWCPVGGAGVGLRTRGRWFWIGGRCRGDRMVG